jgi:transcriptional regulator with XRE-family HTH domain
MLRYRHHAPGLTQQEVGTTRYLTASGLSLAQVSKRMGAKSRTAFARYEKGQVAPTVGMLDTLLHALMPEGGLKVWV